MADKTELPSNSSFLKCLQWAAKGGGLNPDLPYGGQGPTQSSHYLLSKEVGFVNGVETGTQALI